MSKFGAFIRMFAWAGVAIRVIAAIAEKSFMIFTNEFELG